MTLSVPQGLRYATMPDLGGQNEGQALAELRQLGLNATTKSSPVGEAFHRVLSQIPAAGTRVDRATCGNPTVTLTII
ncbi:MAG: PASTA domain-containing protein [Aeriscardovia sp.]|nr:PASTA domain-containing protein [Aeriscardovia sp.]